MRVRKRGSLEDAYILIYDYSPTGVLQPGYPIQLTSSAKANGVFETTSDVVVKDFKSRQAAGEVFMNPFGHTADDRQTVGSNLTFGTHPMWGRREIQGNAACYWSVPPVRPAWFNVRISDAKERTFTEAASKVAAEEFLSLVSVAEAHKTASMIARPFGQATELINRMAARRMKLIRNGHDVVRAGTAAWLEYRFGWKPILYDLEGIQNSYVLNESHAAKPVRIVARAADRNIFWDDPGNISVTTPQYTSSVKMVRNFSHRATVASGILYELRDDNLEAATARHMGLRLSDVPSTIWELVPFSFIVDRFVDVGMWLKAIMPKPGVNVLGTWCTTIDYQLNYHSLVEAKINVGSAPATTYTSSGGTYREEILSIARTVNRVYVPPLTANYRNLNLTQSIDHAALILAKLEGLKVRS